ncbi:MAG: glycosyltransferase family 2 protein [Eubacteriales bacterium]|nr:glycosyltransferase family 2 protein [Eubacteriales bacterium]
MEKHAIVIVTYNRAALLKECLEAVESQTRPYDRIVVIDNASSDGTEALLKTKREKPAYHIYREPKNTGGAGGFARGVREAYATGADWVTIIDDDAILEPDFLETICAAQETCRGQSLCYAGVPLTNGIRPGHRRRVLGKRIKKEKAVPVSEYEQEFFTCDIASFCGLVVHRDVIAKVGFPEGRFFIWYDDTEYCLRIAKETKIINVNRAVIQHKVPPSAPMEGFVSWKDYYGIRNRIYMAKKHYGMETVVYITVKKIFRCLLECGKLLAKKKGKEARKEAALYRDAIRDGIGGKLGVNVRYYP